MIDQAQILLIDDDRKFTRLLGELLLRQGYGVFNAHDGVEGLRRVHVGGWSLVVLDLMLPRMDGLSVLRNIRSYSSVPVLMLTGRGSEVDRITGFEHGADDFVAKTASARELIARVQSVLRRAAARPSPKATTVCVGRLVIDVAARDVRIDGAVVELTAAEFGLLLLLARRAGEVCSRDYLLSESSDRKFTGAERSIDVHVTSLRRKLGDNSREPLLIRTVRSVGYLMVSADGP